MSFKDWRIICRYHHFLLVDVFTQTAITTFLLNSQFQHPDTEVVGEASPTVNRRGRQICPPTAISRFKETVNSFIQYKKGIKKLDARNFRKFPFTGLPGEKGGNLDWLHKGSIFGVVVVGSGNNMLKSSVNSTGPRIPVLSCKFSNSLYLCWDGSHDVPAHVWLMPRLERATSTFLVSIFGQPLKGLYINTP